MMDVRDRFSIFSTSVTSVKHVILGHQVLKSSICVSPQKPAVVFDPREEEELHLPSPRCFRPIGGKGDGTPRPLGLSFSGDTFLSDGFSCFRDLELNSDP